MNGSMLRLSSLLLLTIAVGFGCSDGQVSIGDKDAGTPAKTGFVGDWDGYVQAYKFYDGSDRVRLNVSATGTGTIRFGNAELAPKATDPNTKFPPEFPPFSDHGPQNGIPDVWDGFAYTLNGLQYDTDRLQATADGREVFKDWCELQTSHHFYQPSSGDFYTCDVCSTGGDSPTPSDYCRVLSVDECAASYMGDGSIAYSENGPLALCERGWLCRTGCSCDANGCHQPPLVDNMLLDVSLDADQTVITGTLVLQSKNYNVVLKRQ